MVIIGTISNHKKLRFNNLMKQLNGISPKTLSDRLRELTEAGLIKKKIFAEIPPRVEYSLTNRGETLRKAMMPLMKWASQENK